MKKPRAELVLVSLCLFLAGLGISCSKTDKDALFHRNLTEIDALVQQGDTQKAAKQLHKLRKKAQFPVQYLSIAKRELALKLPVQALQSMQAGLKKHPDDTVLKAALVHTLLREERAEDAASYAGALTATAYAGLGAEAYIQSDKMHKTHNTPIELWKEGFRLTGEHIFLENAALMLAFQGHVAEAAALRYGIPKGENLRSPYFWSCLAYDIGNFQPVLDDLFYSLAHADMAGLPENNPKTFEYARRHILLAADACAGLNDMERARAFWQDYVDRYPDTAADVFYNLAMTAPSEKERIERLVECISESPAYYPAVAQYVRAWAAMQKTQLQKNALTELLQSKDFFSLEMEKTLFLSSTFTLSAEQVLENALLLNANDPRFSLENFRYKYLDADNPARGNGAMWRILEQQPDIPLVSAYARWYFARSGDFNACFTIEKTDNTYEDSFYDGLRYAIQGESSSALASFSKSENEQDCTCAAVINQAYIYDARSEPDMAIKYFMRAAHLTNDTVLQSKLYYEAARLFAGRNGVPEAFKLLKEALRLDPNNHRAAVLQQKLQEAQ